MIARMMGIRTFNRSDAFSYLSASGTRGELRGILGGAVLVAPAAALKDRCSDRGQSSSKS